MLSIDNAFFPFTVEFGSMTNNLAAHSKHICLVNLICKWIAKAEYHKFMQMTQGMRTVSKIYRRVSFHEILQHWYHACDNEFTVIWEEYLKKNVSTF